VPAGIYKRARIIALQFFITLKSNKDAKLHLHRQAFDFIYFIKEAVFII
jgi:hypothetical protein